MTPTEYEHEPIRGLPGNLPPGERILWQGSPEWRTFARSALHTRWIGLYFAAVAALALINGSLGGLLAAAASAAAVTALLSLFAVLVARTTVYTITNRRVVLRIGVALQKCINLPFGVIGSAEIRPLPAGHGDIVLVPNAAHRLGYAMLWPHARPMRLSRPQPMLRALPDAAKVAEILARACQAVVPITNAEAPVGRPLANPVREAAA